MKHLNQNLCLRKCTDKDIICINDNRILCKNCFVEEDRK